MKTKIFQITVIFILSLLIIGQTLSFEIMDKNLVGSLLQKLSPEMMSELIKQVPPSAIEALKIRLREEIKQELKQERTIDTTPAPEKVNQPIVPIEEKVQKLKTRLPFCVIVHHSDPITTLTQEQFDLIWTGASDNKLKYTFVVADPGVRIHEATLSSATLRYPFNIHVLGYVSANEDSMGVMPITSPEQIDFIRRLSNLKIVAIEK
jgi:hypothetical protein